jgi:hypothetical protein
MTQRTVLAVTALLLVGVVVGAWRYQRQRTPGVPEAIDQVVVDFAMGHLAAAGADAVQRCGAALANQELDATVTIDTVAGGVEVQGLTVTKSKLEPELALCLAKAFTGTRRMREGRYTDRIPAGRQYELEAHLAMPPVSTGYGQ